MTDNHERRAMRLLLCNGSPRGNAGNTALLLSHFSAGFAAQTGRRPEEAFLRNVEEHRRITEALFASDAAIIAFPLYADSMPSIVKEFIEAAAAAPRDRRRAPRLGFIIQSGFPGTARSRPVERYLETIPSRFGIRYVGTVIRGGVEGIRVKPPFLTRRLFIAFQNLGRHFAVTGEFHPLIVRDLAGGENMPLWVRALLAVAPSPVMNFYWDAMLKRHGAYRRRFDRPYDPTEET